MSSASPSRPSPARAPWHGALQRFPLAAFRAASNALRHLRRRKRAWIVLDEPWSFELLPALRGWRLPFARSASIDLAGLRALLARCRADPRVRGVIVRPELWTLRGALPFAAADEIAEALLEARRAGLRLVAFGHCWGLAELVIASACERRAMPPLGELDLRGLRVTQLYGKRLLERAGLRAEVVKRAEYKGAADALIEERMPAPQREALGAFLDDVHEWLIARLAELRGESAAILRERLARGPCLASEEQGGAWIDHVLYEDELVAAIDPACAERELCSITGARRWLLRRAAPPRARRQGVLRVEGAIVRGRSRRRALPFFPRTTGLEDFKREVRAARRRRDIERWVLHIDSPGGDALASDLMHRELGLLARERELVAHLGSVAASGGYYIATAARRIEAHATTLTGSIGVLAGKLDASGLLEKLGIGAEHVDRGRFQGLRGWTSPLEPDERALLERAVDAIYARFRRCVAEGRGLADAEVERLARGRIWSGRAAHTLRLVDALGSFAACERGAEVAR
ncbi:MAG: S49 family peptidase [Planctomycetes bacterium]|nr:S49 family peptidase [Planctomycetota bacterium]